MLCLLPDETGLVVPTLASVVETLVDPAVCFNWSDLVFLASLVTSFGPSLLDLKRPETQNQKYLAKEKYKT